MALNYRPHTVERWTLETNTDGVDVETMTETFEVSGNLQHVRPDELKNLPDDFRNAPGAKYKFFTGPGVDMRIGGIRVGETQRYGSDRIRLPNGTVVYVHGVDDRSEGIKPHKRYWCYGTQTLIGRAETP